LQDIALAGEDRAEESAIRGLFSRRTKMVDLDKSVLKRNDLYYPGAPVSLNPKTVPKILCFQSLFSENDQFCSPAKQRPF
jgi:hypothetical protein